MQHVVSKLQDAILYTVEARMGLALNPTKCRSAPTLRETGQVLNQGVSCAEIFKF